jgi:ligand-binding SRPBCC domain-containing protein
MATIILETKVEAPIQRCFDLSLSVDLHQLSTEGTNEKAIAGITSGLMKHNDVVTWEAKHLGVTQRLTTRISEYDAPHFFVSEMMKGAFKRIRHQHIFKEQDKTTLMTDILDFDAPMGIPGKIFSALFLKGYMKRLLIKRNETIKKIAESNEWEKFIFDNVKK